MKSLIFEAIGLIAGMCIAIPALPQIRNTRKTHKVDGLSPMMFRLLGIGNACYFLYGFYLGSLSMMVFNSISVVCSVTMLILIHKYGKKQ